MLPALPYKSLVLILYVLSSLLRAHETMRAPYIYVNALIYVHNVIPLCCVP